MKGLRGVLAATSLLAVTGLLSGCKGFWNPPTGGGGGGGGSASGVFYVMNTAKSQVAGFAFTSGSTTPKAITNGSATLGAQPLAIAMAPGGGFLYVSTGGGIFAYSIGSGGVLTLLNNNQALSADLPTAMAVDGSGTWLVESIGGSAVLNAIPISSSTGILDSARTVQTVSLPNSILTGIAASPASSASPYVFVAMGAGGTAVIPFTSGSTSNPFGTVGVINALHNKTGGATAVAVDPTNRLLYVAETTAFTSGTQTGGLRVFTIGASSKMTEVSGSPYQSGGTGPSAILPTADGSFVYVANTAVSGITTGNITGYPVTSSGGTYSLGTLINTIAAGTDTAGLAEDSTGTYVLAVNSGGPDLSVYTFDTTTSGKLDAAATVATGSDPVQAKAILAVPK